MEWIAGCWKLVLCLAVFVLAIAVLVYIIVKHGYELKIGNKKVEVTHKNSSTQNTRKRA